MPETNLNLTAPLADWKVVYRVLHAHLTDHLELMDTSVLQDLQRELQSAAESEGVDIGHHAAWDEWLGNAAAPCEDRVARRRTFPES